MNHIVLLGDSILDNASYTAGGPAVIDHVRRLLPSGWTASLAAIDGSTTEDIAAHLRAISKEASQLLLSVGGNNAILRADVLETPVSSSGEALLLLADAVAEFEVTYRNSIDACLATGLPLVICTIYNGNFPEPSYQRRATVALTAFNDVIVRVALDKHLKVIDLRLVCNSDGDYANPLEPSASGGSKIAGAILRSVLHEHPHRNNHIICTA